MMQRRVVAVIAAAALGLGACSQAAKQDAVEAVRDSIPDERGQVIGGSYSLTIQPGEIGGTRQVQINGGLLSTAQFAAEPAARRSALLVRDGDASTPIFVGADRLLYARRATQSARERRPWVKVDLDRIAESDTPTLQQLTDALSPGDAVLLNPQFLLDLLAGALTGSIEESDRSDGGTTYRFNVSIDKANRSLKLDEDERDDREKLLKTIAVTGDVHRAVADLRPDGSLARLKVVLTERPDKQASIEIHAELKLDASPPARTIAVPSAAESVRVGSVGDIRTTVAERIIKAAAQQAAVQQTLPQAGQP